MKNITKFTSIAILAALSATAAFADDQQLQNRLASQRQDTRREQQSTTIAFYGGGQGLGHRFVAQDARPELRFEWRANAKGQGFGVYVPVK